MCPHLLLLHVAGLFCKDAIYIGNLRGQQTLKNLKTTIKPMKKYSHDAFSPLLWPEG